MEKRRLDQSHQAGALTFRIASSAPSLLFRARNRNAVGQSVSFSA